MKTSWTKFGTAHKFEKRVLGDRTIWTMDPKAPTRQYRTVYRVCEERRDEQVYYRIDQGSHLWEAIDSVEYSSPKLAAQAIVAHYEKSR